MAAEIIIGLIALKKIANVETIKVYFLRPEQKINLLAFLRQPKSVL